MDKNVFLMDNDDIAREYRSGISVPRQGQCRRAGPEPNQPRLHVALRPCSNRNVNTRQPPTIFPDCNNDVSENNGNTSLNCEVDAASMLYSPVINLSSIHV